MRPIRSWICWRLRRRGKSLRACTPSRCRALKRPEAKERFAATYIAPLGTVRENFGAYIGAEIAKRGKLIKTAGLRSE